MQPWILSRIIPVATRSHLAQAQRARQAPGLRTHVCSGGGLIATAGLSGAPSAAAQGLQRPLSEVGHFRAATCMRARPLACAVAGLRGRLRWSLRPGGVGRHPCGGARPCAPLIAPSSSTTPPLSRPPPGTRCLAPVRQVGARGICCKRRSLCGPNPGAATILAAARGGSGGHLTPTLLFVKLTSCQALRFRSPRMRATTVACAALLALALCSGAFGRRGPLARALEIAGCRSP